MTSEKSEQIHTPLPNILKKDVLYALVSGGVVRFIFDYIAIVCAEWVAIVLRNFLMPGPDYFLPFEFIYVIIPLSCAAIMYLNGLYYHASQFWRVIQRMFKSVLWTVMFLVLVQFARHDAEKISRLFAIIFMIFGFFFLVMFRWFSRKILVFTGLARTKTLLIGGGSLLESMLPHLSDELNINYDFVGILSDEMPVGKEIAGIKVLGRFSDLKHTINDLRISHVIIFSQKMSLAAMRRIINAVEPIVPSVAVVPYLAGIPNYNVSVESFYEERSMMFMLKNNLSNPFYVMAKRVFEWTLTLAGTIMISPILVIIAIWIHRDSPGPIFFKHKRIGKNGKEFYCLKFRSMCVDSKERLEELLARDPEARAEWERDFKLKNDPRITKSGAFLRKTSLDELPQIFNVLKGDMSLVGPRPIVAEEIERYHEHIVDYYMVRPGITGLWQVSGRSDTGYEERVAMDSWYVRNWSIWMDLVILVRTIKIVIGCKGSY